MTGFAKLLVILAGLGFILAIIGTFIKGPILGVTAEGFSRGCTNLALIAIALSLTHKEKSSAS